MDFDFVSRRAYLQPLDPEFVGDVAATEDVRDLLVTQPRRSRSRMERALPSHGAGGDTARKLRIQVDALGAAYKDARHEQPSFVNSDINLRQLALLRIRKQI